MLITPEVSACRSFLPGFKFVYLHVILRVIQISIEEIKEDGGKVVVKCVISAVSSEYFSSSSAEVHFPTVQFHFL